MIGGCIIYVGKKASIRKIQLQNINCGMLSAPYADDISTGCRKTGRTSFAARCQDWGSNRSNQYAHTFSQWVKEQR